MTYAYAYVISYLDVDACGALFLRFCDFVFRCISNECGWRMLIYAYVISCLDVNECG